MEQEPTERLRQKRLNFNDYAEIQPFCMLKKFRIQASVLLKSAFYHEENSHNIIIDAFSSPKKKYQYSLRGGRMQVVSKRKLIE
ncbi:MAG: hypothetical protein MSC57_04600 [Peptoniphilaceae bacterium]|nr:hypothetical protein [Peptoniphilaceae bacterium]